MYHYKHVFYKTVFFSLSFFCFKVARKKCIISDKVFEPRQVGLAQKTIYNHMYMYVYTYIKNTSL